MVWIYPQNRLIIYVHLLLMTILLVLLEVVMNLRKSTQSVSVIGLMKNVNVVLRKNRKDSLKMTIEKQKKLESVSLMERVNFLLDIARNNSFAKYVYTRRDLYLSPCVLPQSLEQQFEYVFNKLFSL